MPQSKHRRKGKVRKRPTRNAPPVKKPPPSAPWVPIVGTGLLIGGLAVILLGYLATPVQQFFAGWPVLSSNWSLAFGFLFLIGGFGVLTRWR